MTGQYKVMRDHDSDLWWVCKKIMVCEGVHQWVIVVECGTKKHAEDRMNSFEQYEANKESDDGWGFNTVEEWEAMMNEAYEETEQENDE